MGGMWRHYRKSHAGQHDYSTRVQETGKHVAKVSDMKKLHLEVGGKESAIVADDADLALTSKKCLKASL